MKIISITGTKGKTTITRALGFVITDQKQDTLRVDTDGHYINEQQKSTLQDSRNLFSKAPTVCPGKYLITMKKYFPKFTAIFETAIGSNGFHGLGYGFHQVGIFSNVLEDHLGITKNLKSRVDLARSKSFIFRNIDEGGAAVFNADDKFVCSQLKEIPNNKQIALIPVGITFNAFDVQKHYQSGGIAITIADNWVIIKSKNKIQKIVDVRDISWTFQGQFIPSVYNLMFIIGGLYAWNNYQLSASILQSLKNYRFDQLGGRLTLLKNKKGVKILVDYAHEKYSLIEVAKLGNLLKSNHLIGVVRLAPDRTNKMIIETGQKIANIYDDLIIYDKIDGVNRGRYVGKNVNITREIGEVSQLLLKGIQVSQKKGRAERVIVEEQAIKRSAEVAEKGDIVVVICGDDHKKTIQYIKKYFQAKFI